MFSVKKKTTLSQYGFDKEWFTNNINCVILIIKSLSKEQKKFVIKFINEEIDNGLK